MQSALALIETASLSAVNLCQMVLHDADLSDIKAQAEETLNNQLLAAGPIVLIGERAKQWHGTAKY